MQLLPVRRVPWLHGILLCRALLEPLDHFDTDGARLELSLSRALTPRDSPGRHSPPIMQGRGVGTGGTCEPQVAWIIHENLQCRRPEAKRFLELQQVGNFGAPQHGASTPSTQPHSVYTHPIPPLTLTHALAPAPELAPHKL